ncbi:hypothetical protein Bbad01_15860 [Bacillus badius]|nr:hypothetical protein Bbad01_15860 [Bacillus badius]
MSLEQRITTLEKRVADLEKKATAATAANSEKVIEIINQYLSEQYQNLAEAVCDIPVKK